MWLVPNRHAGGLPGPEFHDIERPDRQRIGTQRAKSARLHASLYLDLRRLPPSILASAFEALIELIGVLDPYLAAPKLPGFRYDIARLEAEKISAGNDRTVGIRSREAGNQNEYAGCRQ